MANSAISAADKTTLRTSQSHVVKPTLNLVAPQTVATALVNGAVSTFPAVDITVDNTVTWTNAEVGQLVKIASSTGVLKTWGVVRKSLIANTLYLDPKKLGEPGFPERIETAIADNDVVTIYNHKPLWGLYSRIFNKAFFKEHDLTYTDENKKPPPVANAGSWQYADGSTITPILTLPRSGANSSYAHGTATITTYAWTLPTGVTIRAGYATSDAVIKVDATPGQYLVKLTVTDSNSNTHTAGVWLFVKGTGYTPFGDSYTWQVTGDSQDMTGREMTIDVWGSGLDETVILPGAAILYTETSTFGGSVVSDGVLVDTFVGYVTQIDSDHDGEVPHVVLTVRAPLKVAEDIKMPSQLLVEVAGTPANWTECTTVLSHPGGAIFYLLRWHCRALLDMHDLDVGSLTTYRKLTWPFDAGSLAGMLAKVAELILGNIGSASDGTTVLRRNPIREDNTYRNSLAEVFDWQPGDIVGQLAYPHSFRMQVGEVTGAARSYIGGGASGIQPYAAIRRQGQGVGTTRINDFVLDSSQALDRVREAVGHWYAEANNPTPEIKITADRNLDIADPAYLVWHSFLIPADTTYDPRGKGWNTTRMLVKRVDRRWEQIDMGGHTDFQKVVEITVQPETFGQPGDELPWPRGEGQQSIDFGWSVSAPVPFAPVSAAQQANFVLAWNSDGQLVRTFNFTGATPIWQNLSSAFTGTVCDVQWDYNSGFFQNGYVTTEPLSLFVVTANGTSLTIYHVKEIRAGVLDVTLKKTYTMNDSSCTTGARIDVSREVDDFVAVHWHDQSGNFVGRSTDNGATWGSVVTVGSTTTDTGNDNADVGFAIDGQAQLAIGWDGAAYTLYRAATSGAAFSAVSGASTVSRPPPMVQVDFEDSAYIVYSTVTTGVNTVTLDPTNEPLYTESQEATQSLINGADATAVYALSNPSAHHLDHVATSEPNTMTLDVKWVLHQSAFDDNPINAEDAMTVRFEKQTTSSSPGGIDFTINWTVTVTFHDNTTDTDSGTLTYNNATATTDGPVSGIYTHWVAYDMFTTIALAGKKIKTIEATAAVSSSSTTPQASSTWRISHARPRIDITESIYAGALRRVDAVHTAPAWTTITPATPTSSRPDTPYGLGVSKQDVNDIAIIGADASSDWRLFQSEDQGATWSNGGVSSYRLVKRSGNLLLLAGVESLGFSADAGTTIEDKRGNLDDALAGMNTMRGILALL